MSPRILFTVYRKELRDALRDRRTLIAMFVLPTVVIPVIVFGFGLAAAKAVRTARAEIPTVMVVGAADSPVIRAVLAADTGMRIVKSTEDFAERITAKELRAAVELPDDFDDALARGEPVEVRIHHYEGEFKSGFAAAELERFFRSYTRETVVKRLNARGVDASVLTPFSVRRHNVAPPEKVGGNLLGGFIPYLIILLSFTGAMYPAIDLTAGEKERGTMETLLCAPVARIDLVLGKFLMVLTGSLCTVALAGISAAVTLPFGARLLAGTRGGSGGGSLPMLIDPLGLAASFLLILPVAVLFSAGLFALALGARTQKEAQSTLSPLILLAILPAIAGLLPGLELNARLAWVPLLNVSLACKELVSGTFHPGLLVVVFGSTCAYAAAALALAVRMFSREEVIFRV